MTPLIIKHPAILATFYGEAEPTNALAALMVREMPLREIPNVGWGDHFTETFLRRFVPVSAPDTVVLQLTLSWTEGGIEQWDNMRAKLEGIIRDEQLAKLWGYTLVYQAVVEAGDWPPSEESRDHQALLNQVRPLHANAARNMPLLARHAVAFAGGELWLTHVPLKKGGTEAATVYLALSPSEATERIMFRKVLLGSLSPLLMPDLIAHKSYYLRREYTQKEIRARYEQAAHTLHQAASSLIQESISSPAMRNLNSLMQEHDRFFGVVQDFDELYLSLKRQAHHYDIWQPRANLGQVLTFHGDHIKTTLIDLELLNQKARNSLEATKSSIDMIQTRLDREAAEREQARQTWFAIIGTALAVPQIVDREIAATLLSYSTLYPEPAGGYDLLLLMLIQVIITALSFVLVRLVIWIQK